MRGSHKLEVLVDCRLSPLITDDLPNPYCFIRKHRYPPHWQFGNSFLAHRVGRQCVSCFGGTKGSWNQMQTFWGSSNIVDISKFLGQCPTFKLLGITYLGEKHRISTCISWSFGWVKSKSVPWWVCDEYFSTYTCIMSYFIHPHFVRALQHISIVAKYISMFIHARIKSNSSHHSSLLPSWPLGTGRETHKKTWHLTSLFGLYKQQYTLSQRNIGWLDKVVGSGWFLEDILGIHGILGISVPWRIKWKEN